MVHDANFMETFNEFVDFSLFTQARRNKACFSRAFKVSTSALRMATCFSSWAILASVLLAAEAVEAGTVSNIRVVKSAASNFFISAPSSIFRGERVAKVAVKVGN